jgi:predicted nucleic acid-binding Zn ribbon protein
MITSNRPTDVLHELSADEPVTCEACTRALTA